MVSSWGTDSSFNHEQMQIGDIKIITSTYVSSGSFVSWLRYNYTVHKIYTGVIIDLRSKTILIHGSV